MSPLSLYRLFMSVAAPAVRWRQAQRARREPGYAVAAGERRGRYSPDVATALQALRTEGAPRLWVHAVSLGETRAAVALVEALRHRVPELRVVWTHGTATGRAAGESALKPGDVQLWQPLDTEAAVSRFLDATQPSAGVLMETEIWPEMLHQAEQRRLPMLLANARLSERSARKGERFRKLLRPAVRSLSAVLAQTPEDAGRLVASGARAEVVQVCGNLKFDMAPAPDQLALGRAWMRTLGPRPVVMMASSREGEEAALLQAWARALRHLDAAPSAGNPLLLVVPRHPQRFDEVASLIRGQGFALARRSAWGESLPGTQALSADVWLGDSLGEMAAYYSLAHVALLGGSFERLGGQNLIEAAACGCPVIMGPHTFNFADAAQRAEQAGAAHRVPDMAEAVRCALALLARQRGDVVFADAPRIDRNRALGFAQAHSGAAERMADAIVPWLKRRG